MKIKDILQRDPATHPLVNQGQARIVGQPHPSRRSRSCAASSPPSSAKGSTPTASRRSSGRTSTIRQDQPERARGSAASSAAASRTF